MGHIARSGDAGFIGMLRWVKLSESTFLIYNRIKVGATSCCQIYMLLERRWDDARKVRNLMKTKGVAKVPGASVIDFKGIVHRFVAGDWSHPESTQIYEKWYDISKQLMRSSLGYSPDTEEVLLDVEEEKEHALSVHSEKLAIAYGFLHQEPAEVIRIVKNLRVCRDCHHVTKLISRVYV